jgi:hypothetical protein
MTERTDIVSIEAIQPGCRSYPDKSLAILEYGADLVIGQAMIDIQMLELILFCLRNGGGRCYQCQEYNNIGSKSLHSTLVIPERIWKITN